MRRALFVIAILVAAAAQAFAATPSATALQRALDAEARGFHGHIAFFATDLRGRSVGINAETEVPTASVIKLAVLFEALKQVQAGRARFDDRLVMTRRDPVQGSGLLQFFDTPLHLTFKDALTMMIVVSDNTGTNLAIDHLGLANIDRRIKWLGLRHTWLYKKVFVPPAPGAPADQPRFGLGKTTPREMAEIMRRFAQCDLSAPGSHRTSTPADQKICDVALTMLKNQSDQQAIPRYLDVPVANKTGSLDDVRNDVAIVLAKRGPIVISAFTYGDADHRWSPDNGAVLLIGRMAKLVVDAWR